MTDWIRLLTGDAFPWGTLVVNVVGCLGLGFFMVWVQATLPSPRVREFVAIGLLGSFTTFSTFSYEGIALVRAGTLWRAGIYTVGSVAVGGLAVVVGAALALAVSSR